MLHHSISSSFRNPIFCCFFLVLGLATTLITGCDNPGSVGADIPGSGGASVEVVEDTISIVADTTFNSYSGSFSYFSAGAFSDPLFGDLRATGMLKPALPNNDSLEADAKMKMRLLLSADDVYGDTLASQSFDVYEISEFWRARAYKLKDEIQLDKSRKIASFTVGTEDSMDVLLDQQWVQNSYLSYTLTDSTAAYEDSLYDEQEFGLALVPTNSNKIIPLDARSTRFVIQNPETDTFEVGTDQSAYYLSRMNEPAPPEGSKPVHNMLERILSFGMDLSGVEANGPTISKAELIFYQNQQAMEQSISGTVQRPQPQSALLHFVDPEQTPANLIPGNPIASGTYSEEDHAYHFDVTSVVRSGLINGLSESQKFYLTLPNDGTVKSTLITVDPSSPRAPKLIITYLKNSNN